MIIAATGDVHSPKYYNEFLNAIEKLGVNPDLFLMVGDMIDRGIIKEFEKIYNTLFGKINCPIVSCFGNNEYPEIRERIKEEYKDIRFLDDETVTLTISGVNIGIIGTTGSLDTPTPWQKKNVPDIEILFKNRLNFVDENLEKLVSELRFVILLIHYSPTYKTLEGENPMFYSSLGSKAYEEIIIKRKPWLVVHGHSHRGSRHAWIDTIPIFNASFPLNREILIIDTEKDLKPGITKFI
ncbi:MAG: metallophosphoesterase [Candidatus Aenigmatarchaeota archaeon]